MKITISKNAIPAHARHQDGRDIIPAPAAGCPGASAPAAAPSATPAATPAVTPAASNAAPASTVAADVRHSTLQTKRTTRGTVHVLGERATRGPSRTAARVRALASSMRGSLPFTGLQIFGVFALGALLLGSGLAVRSRT